MANSTRHHGQPKGYMAEVIIHIKRDDGFADNEHHTFDTLAQADSFMADLHAKWLIDKADTDHVEYDQSYAGCPCIWWQSNAPATRRWASRHDYTAVRADTSDEIPADLPAVPLEY